MAILKVFILAVALKGLTEAAGILPDGPLNGSIGGSVMFTTSLTETDGPFTTVTWNFGAATFFIHSPDVDVSFPGYEDRITFFPSTASLELRDLTMEDGGEYGVNVLPNNNKGTINLDIYVPVSSVTVTPQSADLVEFSSFSLTCSSSGSSLSFIWMNSSSEVTASDRVQITDGGSTLTVVNVIRYDEQSYKCHVFNPVSEGISDPVNISVSYGPENTNMSVSPSQEFYEEGSDVILNCSADSRPSAQFSWFLNGTKLPDSGPELTLRNIQISQRGDYSCQAFNSKTLTNETSPSLFISVLQKISGVSIKASTEQIIEGSSVTLTCEASGYSPSRKWMKDGSDLSLSENVTLSEENKVLTFKAVNRNNSGVYVCFVNNFFSSSEAKFTFVVTYGPQNVPNEGCSTGCIVGIVIGCLVLVAAAAGGGFYVYRSKSAKRSSNGNNGNRRGHDGQDNTSYASEDVNYADIKFSKNKNKNNISMQMDEENVTSNYAQIRVNNQPTGAHPPNYDAHMNRVNRQVS